MPLCLTFNAGRVESRHMADVRRTEMKIEDKRETSAWVPAERILAEVIPHMPTKWTRGIRKLVLLDKDYHPHRDAAGRYCLIKGTRRADIELFFDYYAEFPDGLSNDYHYQRYRLICTLCHELYHHFVNGQRIMKKPCHKMEEKRASFWSDKASRYVMSKLYTKAEFQEHRDRINGILLGK